MKKLTYSQLRDAFYGINEKGAKAQTAIVVFDQSNWPDDEYTEEQRSYRVSSNCYGFIPGKISNAVYGDCLDGKDLGVRLDWYNWKVEYCYIEE